MAQLWELMALATIVVSVIILSYFLWKKLQDRKAGYPRMDERKERIDGKAAWYSMLLTTSVIITISVFYALITALFGYTFDPWIAITLLVVVLVMALSFMGFRVLFNRRGDFE